MVWETSELTVRTDGDTATLHLAFDALTLDRLRTIDAALTRIECRSRIEKLVIRSTHPDGLRGECDPEMECEGFTTAGQAILNRLAQLPILTLAVIEGPVSGPGWELALACDYRLAFDGATVGFPELVHGVVPAWGGLTRLARIAGASRAMEFVTGKQPLSARAAERIGAIDRVASPTLREVAVRGFLDRMVRKPRAWRTPLDGWAARRVLAAYQPWLAKNPHPARAAALSIVPFASESEAAGLRAERASFESIRAHTVAAAERSLRQRELSLLGKYKVLNERPALAVIGSVEPVAGLVREHLIKGGSIWLEDIDIHSNNLLLASHIDMSSVLIERARNNIHNINDGDINLFDICLVTSHSAAALELAEALTRPGGAIAPVNTECLRTASSRSGNLLAVTLQEAIAEIGSVTPLPGVVEAFCAWLVRVGVTPIEVAGSVASRLRVAWWDEAVRLVADGLPIDVVDDAARTLGAVTGPLEMLDGVGFESVAHQVPRVRPLLAAGIRGRPHGEGFYVLADDAPSCANAVAQLVLLEAAAGPHALPRLQAEIDPTAARQFCRDRFAARMTVAAAALLANEPCVGPAEIDLALVRGLGLFAADGGVFRRADRIGLRRVVEDLRALRQQQGDRFKPPAELTRRALADESYYDSAPRPLRQSA